MSDSFIEILINTVDNETHEQTIQDVSIRFDFWLVLFIDKTKRYFLITRILTNLYLFCFFTGELSRVPNFLHNYPIRWSACSQSIK